MTQMVERSGRSGGMGPPARHGTPCRRAHGGRPVEIARIAGPRCRARPADGGRGRHRRASLYARRPEEEGAETLILSSGLGGAGSYWSPNLASLGERYRILTYDHRGTGRSDRALPDPVTIDTMADDIVVLMDGLAIGQAHVLGHALGGLIGLALALAGPIGCAL